MNNHISSEIEKLLYKLIFQFSIYTLGSDKRLEPHLINLNKSLKKGVSYFQLTPELNTLSKTLTQISNSAKQWDVTQAPSSSSQQLILLLTHLSQLLDETTIPAKFTSQYSVFKQKSQQQPLSIDSTYKVIDLALSITFNIINSALSEQQHIETFLSQFSEQFIMLGQHTADISKSNKSAIENNKNLRLAVSQQVDNIHNSSSNAQELSSLQKSITHHLEELTIQCQKHRETENKQLIDSQNQLAQMSKKLQALEAETDSLRNNLKIAHDKAFHDALTGLPNRLAFDEKIINEYNRWHRYNSPLSLIIWDIDLFKSINDTYGHKAGDKTLALVAQLILKNCRETDFLARYGGEEFVMLLPNTTSAQSLIIADKIRLIIASSGFNFHGKSIKLTISCGISQFSKGDTQEDVFYRSDHALYSSKEQGRNKCSVFDK